MAVNDQEKVIDIKLARYSIITSMENMKPMLVRSTRLLIVLSLRFCNSSIVPLQAWLCSIIDSAIGCSNLLLKRTDVAGMPLA